LPAVQKVREAAARMSCQNNLKQIALASMNYESGNGVLPPGINVSPNSINTGPNPAGISSPPYAGPYTGVLAYLLPYMEQNNIYNALPTNLFQLNTTAGAWAYNTPPYSSDGNNTGFPAVCNSQIKSYTCPSDNAQTTSLTPDTNYGSGIIDATFTVQTIYVTIDWVNNTPGFGAELGASNYVGNAGLEADNTGTMTTTNGVAIPWSLYKGPYYNSSKTRIADITDGTSNTVGFGETLGGQAPPQARDFRRAWMGSGVMWGAWGLPSDTGTAWYAGWSSKHTGIVQFSMCDGSVRNMPKGITGGTQLTAFANVVGMADGMVIDFTQLGN
jgi:hypothetical protein